VTSSDKPRHRMQVVILRQSRKPADRYGRDIEFREEVRDMKIPALSLLLMVTLGGCSVVMEATRPTPVDLVQFQPGDARDSVTERLGAPHSTAIESDGSSCDCYELYTHGYGTAGKVGIAVVEGAADFFTLGLAEIVSTPTEGVTRNQTYPVTFCYRDGKLARISESGRVIASGLPPVTAANHSQTAISPETNR
jgi:hypothetical protein